MDDFGMTEEEMLSEGLVNSDYFYNPKYEIDDEDELREITVPNKEGRYAVDQYARLYMMKGDVWIEVNTEDVYPKIPF